MGLSERELENIIAKLETDVCLDLVMKNIGADGAKSLARALETNTTLTNLNLGGNNIGVDGANAIFNALKNNTALAKLNIVGNSIGVDAENALFEALETNTGLTDLDLNGNNIGDDGANALFEALKINITLTNLNLFFNGIGDDGMKGLPEALKINESLTSLDLGGNGIGVDGVKALVEALKKNKNLKSLCLDYNHLGDNGVKALAHALKNNTILRHLSIKRCSMGADGAKALSDALEANTSLTNLDYDISYAEVDDTINKRLERNKCIAEFNRLLNGIKPEDLLETKHIEHLNYQLAQLEEMLEEFVDYPGIHAQLTRTLRSLYLRVYIQQGDILSALAFYAEQPELEDDALLGLGEFLYASDVPSLIGESDFDYTQDDKNKAALAFLSQTYQNEETQKFLLVIAKNLIKEKQNRPDAALGVSLLIPEEKLALLMTSLSPGHKAKRHLDEVLQMLQSTEPQNLHDKCQCQPLKATLERVFGSSELATIESVMRHADKFPVKKTQEDTVDDMTKTNRSEPVNTIENAAFNINSTTPGKKGILYASLSPLLEHAQKSRATELEKPRCSSGKEEQEGSTSEGVRRSRTKNKRSYSIIIADAAAEESLDTRNATNAVKALVTKFSQDNLNQNHESLFQKIEMETNQAEKTLLSDFEAIIDKEHESLDALKNSVIGYYNENESAINHPVNKIHAFFSPNPETSTHRMFDEIFKALDISERDISAAAPR